MYLPALLFALFITRGTDLAVSNSALNINIFGNPNTGSDSLANSDSPPGCDWNPLPGDITVSRIAVHAGTAVTQTCTFQMFKGIPASLTGSTVVLSSGGTDAEGAVSVTAATPANAADLGNVAFGWQGTASSAAGTVRGVFQYSIASPYSAYSIMASGFSTDNFFSSGTGTRYLAPNVQSSSTTEADTQFAVSRAGTFQYLLIVILTQSTANDSTYTATVRKNGAATAITASVANTTTPLMATDVSNTFTVVAGDLVDFEFKTSGTRDNAHRARVYAAIGFLPS